MNHQVHAPTWDNDMSELGPDNSNSVDLAAMPVSRGDTHDGTLDSENEALSEKCHAYRSEGE